MLQLLHLFCLRPHDLLTEIVFTMKGVLVVLTEV